MKTSATEPCSLKLLVGDLGHFKLVTDAGVGLLERLSWQVSESRVPIPATLHA